jgi:hypothetical protein
MLDFSVTMMIIIVIIIVLVDRNGVITNKQLLFQCNTYAAIGPFKRSSYHKIIYFIDIVRNNNINSQRPLGQQL